MATFTFDSTERSLPNDRSDVVKDVNLCELVDGK